MIPKHRLGIGWRISALLSPKKRLLLGIFSDQFLFRCGDGVYVFGRYRHQNEGRHLDLLLLSEVSREFIVAGAIACGHSTELTTFLSENVASFKVVSEPEWNRTSGIMS